MCLEKYLVEQCAPTLASLKTGSLFGVIEDDAGELTRQVAEWQAQLAPKGLILTILRYRRGRALIYMGRLSQLKRDLACPGAEELLRSCGYEHENTEDILRQLRRRVCTCESFPHDSYRTAEKTASVPATGRCTATSRTPSGASKAIASAARSTSGSGTWAGACSSSQWRHENT